MDVEPNGEFGVGSSSSPGYQGYYRRALLPQRSHWQPNPHRPMVCGNQVVMAFDIETTKAPLKFPDQPID